MEDSLIDKTKDVWEKALLHISQHLELEKVKDYTELLGDIFKVVNFVRGTTSFILQKRFEHFLKGFSKKDVPTEKQIEKLMEYIDNEKKAEFIADTFSKIILARSSKACLIMGTLLQTMLDNKDDLTYKELIVIQALSTFFDEDITNFMFIFNFIDQERQSKVIGRDVLSSYLSGKHFNEELEKNGLDKNSMQLTIEKLAANQLLTKSSRVKSKTGDFITAEAETEPYFQVTEPGVLLHTYIIRSGL